MGSITIHSLDPEINEKLNKLAKEKNKSKNKLIKEILARQLGLSGKGYYSEDYAEFCGIWSKEEYQEFTAAQKSNEYINTEDWK